MQNYLDALYEYSMKWRLCVNIEKTKIMIFRKGGRLSNNLDFKYGNYPIEIVRRFSYLGVVFTTGGSFTDLQKTLVGQAQKEMYQMQKYLNQFVSLKPSHVCDIFDKLIHPILSYGCEVWGVIQGRLVERMHLKFCKQLLGVKKTTQNNFVYGQLDRYPLIVHRQYRIIKFWLKNLEGENRKFTKICYDMMLNDMVLFPNKNNWVIRVRNVLNNTGFSIVWQNHGLGNEIAFLTLLRQILQDMFIQDWHSRLDLSSKASLYRNLSNILCYKSYLDSISVVKFRIALTKLRTAAHRLLIETGRWVKPKSIALENRKCIRPTCNIIEDEFHFILVCPMYSSFRHYIPKYYTNSMFKFIELLNNNNELIVRRLALYCFKAFEKRNIILYNQVSPECKCIIIVFYCIIICVCVFLYTVTIILHL